MKQINCNLEIKTLAGDSIPDGKDNLTVGAIVASILSTERFPNIKPLKAYALAQRFFSSETIELDDSDLSDVLAAVEANEKWIPLVLAQVIQELKK